MQVRLKGHAGHCWRSKDLLICNILLWTFAHGHTSVSQPAKTCLHQLRVDTGCNLEDLPRVMDGERECQGTLCCQCDLMSVTFSKKNKTFFFHSVCQWKKFLVYFWSNSAQKLQLWIIIRKCWAFNVSFNYGNKQSSNGDGARLRLHGECISGFSPFVSWSLFITHSHLSSTSAFSKPNTDRHFSHPYNHCHKLLSDICKFQLAPSLLLPKTLTLVNVIYVTLT